MKRRGFSAFTLLVCITFLFGENYNEIDAVSNASEDIKVTSGQAYADRAVLHTYHKDSYDWHWIGFGTTELYGDTVGVPVSPRENIITLPDLQPSTKYYFKFTGALLDNPTENHFCVGSFTTVEVTPVIYEGKTVFASPLVSRDNVLLSSDFQVGDLLFIRTVQGRIVSTLMVHSGVGNAVLIPSLPEGFYTVEQKRGSNTVATTKLSI